MFKSKKSASHLGVSEQWCQLLMKLTAIEDLKSSSQNLLTLQSFPQSCNTIPTQRKEACMREDLSRLMPHVGLVLDLVTGSLL